MRDTTFNELEDVLAHLNIVFAERDAFRRIAFDALTHRDDWWIQRNRREFDLTLKASKAYHRKYRKQTGADNA